MKSRSEGTDSRTGHRQRRTRREMTYHGKYKRAALKTCRVCGMDAGERKVTESLPERFFVVCAACGYQTRPHKSQTAASREWNRGGE